jgi:hypothetical protein
MSYSQLTRFQCYARGDKYVGGATVDLDHPGNEKAKPCLLNRVGLHINIVVIVVDTAMQCKAVIKDLDRIVQFLFVFSTTAGALHVSR